MCHTVLTAIAVWVLLLLTALELETMRQHRPEFRDNSLSRRFAEYRRKKRNLVFFFLFPRWMHFVAWMVKEAREEKEEWTKGQRCVHYYFKLDDKWTTTFSQVWRSNGKAARLNETVLNPPQNGTVGPTAMTPICSHLKCMPSQIAQYGSLRHWSHRKDIINFYCSNFQIIDTLQA